MCKFYNCLLILILGLVSSACSKQEKAKDILIQAENIVEQQPDSALQLLNAVIFPESLNKNLFNKYHLLLLEAKDKSYKDITSDTIIFAVKDYYLQKKDYPNAAMAAFYCGRVRHEQQDIDKTVEAYMEAEQLADKTGNNNLKGLIQSNWGILNREHSLYDKAIELLKNSIAMYEKAKNYRNEINSLRIIGDCFGLNKQTDSAFYYYNKGLALAILHKMIEQQSDIKNSMGVSYMKQENYKQAIKAFHEAFALNKDSVEQARILLNIAQMYGYENNTDSVCFYMDKAAALHISNPSLNRTSYLLKSQIAEKNGSYQEALNDYKAYYDFTMKVFDSENNNELTEVQTKYDFEKLRIAKKESEVRFFKLLTIISSALFVTGIILLFFYKRYTRNKNLLLESEQKVESLQKTTEQISKKNRNVLQKQVGILGKTALLAIDFNKTGQEDEKKMLRRFNKIVYTQEQWDWEILYQTMNESRNGLYDKIRTKYPQLSELEFRICCLTCETAFTDKEIEKIVGGNLNKVRRTRSELRKELGMAGRENFLVFFENEIL